jgi:hypothetical protein
MSIALLQPEGTLMCSVSCFTRDGEGFNVLDCSVERWYVDSNTGMVEHRNVGEAPPKGNQWNGFYEEGKAYDFSADVVNSYDPGDFPDFLDEEEF